MEVICPLQTTFFTFSGLLAKYGASKKRIFDLYLIATALDNGILSICTWNIKDFYDITEINVKTPTEILNTLKT